MNNPLAESKPTITMDDIESLLKACDIDALPWQKRVLLNLLNSGTPYEVRAKRWLG